VALTGSKSYFKIETTGSVRHGAQDRRPRSESRPERERIHAHGTRPAISARVRIKTGVKRNGTLVAREAEVVMDSGAYADNGPAGGEARHQPA